MSSIMSRSLDPRHPDQGVTAQTPDRFTLAWPLGCLANGPGPAPRYGVAVAARNEAACVNRDEAQLSHCASETPGIAGRFAQPQQFEQWSRADALHATNSCCHLLAKGISIMLRQLGASLFQALVER